jgi:multidrug efflux pump subunit AcrB
MKSIIAWFARHHVAANLLMISIVVAGLMAVFFGMRREFFPSLELDQVTVTVAYPGATPVEVEEGIVLRIEQAIADLPGIDEMRSQAREGFGSVTVDVEEGFDKQTMLTDVKTRVDAITTFPGEAEEPVVDSPVMQREVMVLSLSGDVSAKDLQALAERTRDDLLDFRRTPHSGPESLFAKVGLIDVKTITQVELLAARDYEIGIEVSEAALRRYGLTFDEMVQAVRQSSLDLPAGAIKRRSGEVLLRTVGQANHGHEYADLTLRSSVDGTLVRLGDIAHINDGFADQDIGAWHDGKPAIAIEIFSVGDQDLLAVSDAVHEYVANSSSRLPANMRLAVTRDRSVYYQQRMDTLLSNAGIGLLLVFGSLALFLRLRLAFWVAIGIPLSFLGACWAMPLADVSLNMISMFAFILVLGIVVDDAIVVGEAVHAHQELGHRGGEGVVRGAQRVATPVIFAVLTTIIAFMPMLFISGADGKIWRNIPVVVIGCLAFSLVESLLVLPAHLSMGKQERPPGLLLRQIHALQDRVTKVLYRFVRGIYAPFLHFCLTWRYATIAAFLASLILAVGMIMGGLVKSIGFPRIAADFIRMSISMPVGTHAANTIEVIEHIETQVEAVRQQLDARYQLPESRIKHVVSTLQGATSASVVIELEGAGDLGIDARQVQRDLRKLVGDPPGVKQIEYRSEIGRHSSGVSVEFTAKNMDELVACAEDYKTRIAEYDGVYAITDTFSDGKDELVLRITPEAESLGLRLQNLARQVRQAFYGAEAQRILRGREEVKVQVRYPEAVRDDIATLEHMRIRTSSGDEVPFAQVARVSRGVGFPSIQRTDRQRVLAVTCDVDATKLDGNSLLKNIRADIFPALREAHPEVRADVGGGTKRLQEVMIDLGIGLLLALLAMYGVMAIAFNHWFQPLLIMSAIPFGVVGAVGGHYLLGLEVSLMSRMGIIALSGVVVNDALVLVDAINGLRAEGHPLREAIVIGGERRFRAIMLTTITTFFGLAPLMLETSVQARFLVPMAVSLAFGVVFATVITLILVPCLYRVLEDFAKIFRVAMK